MMLLVISVAMVIVCGVTGSSSPQGVIMMRVPEKEFKDGAEHLVEHYLLDKLRTEYTGQKYNFSVQEKATLSFDNVRLIKTEGLESSVDFRAGNYVEADFRYSILEFELNLDINIGQDVISYQSTVVSILDVFFNISLDIGTGENKAGVTINDCGMDFYTLDSSDKELKSAMLGFIEIGAKDKLKSVFREVCVYLQTEVQATLINILNIEDRLTIHDETNELVNLHAKLEFVETGNNFISAVATATTDGRSTTTVDKDRVKYKFPQQSSDRVDVWLDDNALNILTDKVITQSVFTDTQYSYDQNGNHIYQVYTSLVSATYTMDVTEEGIEVHTNVSLNLRHIGQTENPCIDIQLDMKVCLDAKLSYDGERIKSGKAPIIITYNDAKIIMKPDKHRLYIDYEVKDVTGKCKAKDAQTQKKLVERYDHHLQTRLNDTFFYIDVPKFELLGFRDIQVKTFNRAVVIEGLLQLDLNVLPSVRNSTITHKTAGGKKITVKTTDGQTTTLELIDPSNQPTSLSLRNRSVFNIIIISVSVVMYF